MQDYFYQVLTTKKIPTYVLYYKFSDLLVKGQIVQVTINNHLVYGIIWSDPLDEEYIQKQAKLELDKIKTIYKLWDFRLNLQQIEFLKIFTKQTFNSANLLLSAFLQPFKILNKQRLSQLQKFKEEKRDDKFLKKTKINFGITKNSFIENSDQTKINFFLEKDFLFRISTIIRSYFLKSLNNQTTIHKQQSNFQIEKKFFNQTINILLVFPEQKMLDKYLQIFLAKYSEFSDLSYYCYNGQASQNSRNTVLNLLKNINQINLIWSTRSGIFLPFDKLQEIFLIDEANTLHIQDQNSLYFDTREAVFYLAQAFKANLNFLSTLPSSRLYNFYSKEFLQNQMISSSSKEKKAFKIKITKNVCSKSESKMFSSIIEEILENL